MRILVDGSKVRIGGGIQVSLGLLRYMATDTTHEWHVATSSEIDRELKPGDRKRYASYRVVPTGRNFLSRIFRPRRALLQIERNLEPDLVFSIFGPVFWHASTRHLVGFALPWLIYPDTPVWRWLDWRSWVEFKVLIPLAKRDYRHADYVAVETETVRERVHRHVGIPLERIHVVRNSYSPMFRDTIASLPPTPHEDRWMILVPSSYYVHKNLELLPRAAAVLKKQLDHPFEFVFTLPLENAGWRRIEASARALGVTAEIRSVGAVNHQEIGKLYRCARLVCLPTMLECSTAVYPESFMAEVPVTTSDLDFAREVCEDGALYFDPLSPEAVARTIVQGLTDDVVRKTLVERGRVALTKNYPSPDEKWNAMLAILARCGDATRTGSR